MSSKTAIVTDTNCGLRPEEAAELGIRVIPMPVILDGSAFLNTIPFPRRNSLRP